MRNLDNGGVGRSTHVLPARPSQMGRPTDAHGRRGAYRPGMASTSLPVLAGIASTVIFAASALPMLVKARRTRDLTSYSRGNIMLSNVGNAVHSIYVFSMPVGPLWLLHTFYLASSALMLIWSVRYTAERGKTSGSQRLHVER